MTELVRRLIEGVGGAGTQGRRRLKKRRKKKRKEKERKIEKNFGKFLKNRNWRFINILEIFVRKIIQVHFSKSATKIKVVYENRVGAQKLRKCTRIEIVR